MLPLQSIDLIVRRYNLENLRNLKLIYLDGGNHDEFGLNHAANNIARQLVISHSLYPLPPFLHSTERKARREWPTNIP